MLIVAVSSLRNSESPPDHDVPCSAESLNNPVSERIENWCLLRTTASYVRTIIYLLKTTNVRI